MPGIEDQATTRATRAGSGARPDLARDEAARGSFAGRAVGTPPTERLADSVRDGPSVRDHEYEVVDVGTRSGPVPQDGAQPVRSASGSGSTVAASAGALEPPPMPVRQAAGLRKRWIRIGTWDGVPPGLARAGGAADAPQPERGASRPAQAPRLLAHDYERTLPSAGDSLGRLGTYLVNSLEEGRIPRELKDDLETALLYANQLDGDRDRLARVSAGPDAASLVAVERDVLEATHVGEMSRIYDLLEGCVRHDDATPEARAFARGLQERIGQAYAGLSDLVSAHEPQPPAMRPRGPAAGRPETGLDDFVGAASRSRRANAHVTLTGDGHAAVTTGRLARWRSGRRVAANRATAERFVAALRDRFGNEIANVAASSDGVQRALTSGRALEAQHINEAVFRARRLASDYRAANDRLVRTFTEADRSGVSPMDRKIADVSRRLADHGMRGVASVVDSKELAGTVAQALSSASNAAEHLVTTEEAGRIVETVVGRALLRRYDAERTDAMAKMALDAPESISRRALGTAAQSRGLELDPARLEPGAARGLARRIDEAVRSLDAASLADDAELERTAAEVASTWVAERAEAVAALAGTGLDDEAQALVAAQLLRDQTPPALVRHVAAAYGELKGDLDRLGGGLAPNELQTAFVRIREGMVQAVADAAIPVDVDNQNEVYAQSWRMLLAPGGQTHFESIADQFEPGAALREFAEGLGWTRRRFPLTEEGAATMTMNSEWGGVSIAGKPLSVVSEYQTLVETLSNVVTDVVGRPGEIDDPDGLGDLSTDTLDVLRQMDFPLPRRWADADAGQ